MTEITINCDTQIGEKIYVRLDDVITVTGSYMSLPDWFDGNIGTVTYLGAWAIDLMDGQIILASPRYKLSYPTGYVEVYVEECPQTMTLRPGSWRIDGVVYEGSYTIDGDVTAEEVV